MGLINIQNLKKSLIIILLNTLSFSLCASENKASYCALHFETPGLVYSLKQSDRYQDFIQSKAKLTDREIYANVVQILNATPPPPFVGSITSKQIASKKWFKRELLQNARLVELQNLENPYAHNEFIYQYALALLQYSKEALLSNKKMKDYLTEDNKKQGHIQLKKKAPLLQITNPTLYAYARAKLRIFNASYDYLKNSHSKFSYYDIFKLNYLLSTLAEMPAPKTDTKMEIPDSNNIFSLEDGIKSLGPENTYTTRDLENLTIRHSVQERVYYPFVQLPTVFGIDIKDFLDFAFRLMPYSIIQNHIESRAGYLYNSGEFNEHDKNHADNLNIDLKKLSKEQLKKLERAYLYLLNKTLQIDDSSKRIVFLTYFYKFYHETYDFTFWYLIISPEDYSNKIIKERLKDCISDILFDAEYKLNFTNSIEEKRLLAIYLNRTEYEKMLDQYSEDLFQLLLNFKSMDTSSEKI